MNSYVIWKTELKPDINEIEMPVRARIVSVALQRGQPTMWFMCDPTQPKEKRCFVLTGTGHSIDSEGVELRPIGSMMTEDHNFVFHVLEREELPF